MQTTRLNLIREIILLKFRQKIMKHLKKKHPDAMLLFRRNSSYELYKQDAVKAAIYSGFCREYRSVADHGVLGADFLMVKDPAEKFESVVDYTTVLDNFEGPLDLLLFLIKQEHDFIATFDVVKPIHRNVCFYIQCKCHKEPLTKTAIKMCIRDRYMAHEAGSRKYLTPH